MEEAIITALAVIAAASLIAIADAVWQLRRLRTKLEVARHEVPRDDETGLATKAACIPRISSDIKRAQRTGACVWVGVVTVVGGDSSRFGRLAADALRYPEVGFRLSDNVYCFTCQNAAERERDDVVRRLSNAGPRESITVGEAWWRPGDEVAPAKLLTAAVAAPATVRSKHS